MDPTPKSSSMYKLAIDASLDCRWAEAVKLNKSIIKIEKENIDALNRLGRAYMELGRYNLAKRYYAEVLKYDPYNPIAIKNLKIVKSFKSNGIPFVADGHDKISPSLFLQEPGKTKIVALLKVAEPQKLSKAYCGMRVGWVVKGRKITISDSAGGYLGVLPDDVSHTLIRLSNGGNKYEFFIKSIKVNGLSVLIKETFRSKRFKNQSSFLEASSFSQNSEIITSLENENEEAEVVEDEAES